MEKVLPVLFAVLGVLTLIGVELLARYDQQQSLNQILEWARQQSRSPQVRLADLEARMSGHPRRKLFEHEGTQRALYRWPSLFGEYCLRARVRRDGTILYLDVESEPTEDFISPKLICNEDGVRIPGEGDPHPSVPNESEIAWLLGRARQLRDGPRPERKPGLLVAPAINIEGQVLESGPAIAATLQSLITFAPEQILNIDPRLSRRFQLESGLWDPGTVLDHSRVSLCCRLMDVEEYLVPVCQRVGDKWQCELRFHSLNKATVESVPVTCDQLNHFVTSAAVAVFERLEIPLTSYRQAFLAHAEFGNEAIAIAFSQMLSESLRKTVDARDFYQTVIAPDRRWLAAWDVYLDDESTLNRMNFIRLTPGTAEGGMHPFLQRCQIMAPSAKKHCELLLDLGPHSLGQTLYHQDLVRIARDLHRDDIVEEMFRLWHAVDDTPAGKIARAKEYLAWAIDARGINDWDFIPPDPRHHEICMARVARAKAELKLALQHVPESWGAHAEMIRVAQAEQRPDHEVMEHFERAVEICPLSELPWTYLRRAGHLRAKPDEPDAIYRIVDKTLDSRLWKTDFPQQVPRLLYQVGYDTQNQRLSVDSIRNAEHWSRIQRYLRIVQEDRAPIQIALNAMGSFVHTGMIGGHTREILPVVALIDEHCRQTLTGSDRTGHTDGQNDCPYSPADVSLFVESPFYSDYRYGDCRDRVLALAGVEGDPGIDSDPSAVRVALAEGRFQDAIQGSQRLSTAPGMDATEKARLQAASHWASRMVIGDDIRLRSEDLWNLCGQFYQIGYRPLRDDPNWQPSEMGLIFRHTSEPVKPMRILRSSAFFPVGFRKGSVRGVVEFRGEVDSIEFVARGQGTEDPLVMRYCVSSGLADLRRHGWLPLERGRLETNRVNFEIALGDDVDHFSMGHVIDWTVNSMGAPAGTFGLVINWNQGQAIEVQVSELHLQVLE